MKVLISAITGLIIGGISGFLIANYQYKNKLQEEIEAIRETNKKLMEKKKHKEFANDERQEQIIHESTKPDSQNPWIDPSYDITDEENDIDDSDYMVEYEKEAEKYMVKEGRPYLITEEEYEDMSDGFDKKHIMYYPNEDDPKCCDADSGEELEDWYYVLGFDDDLLEDLEEGPIFIHNDRYSTDYKVELSKFAWV